MKHTVFTPVYNRVRDMQELYLHMLELDYPTTEFEWLIVDDGSTDDLKVVVESFINDGRLNIRYIYQENGGIHIAQNTAIRNALGEYITRIDSDDYLLPHALKNMDKCLSELNYLDANNLAGVVGLCLNKRDMSVRGTRFPDERKLCRGIDLRRQGVYGDRNFCIRTEIMKEFLLPEYRDTKWVPEAIPLWLGIDKKYLTYFVNVPFSVCTEANSNSLSGAVKHKTLSNVMSMFYAFQYRINDGKGYIDFIDLIKSYISIIICSWEAYTITNERLYLMKPFTNIISPVDKMILAILYLPAMMFYFIRK